MCLAIPGRVEEIAVEDDLRVGLVNFGGVLKRICLEYVPEVQVGDYTLVHVGFAISKIDQKSADKTLADFRAVGALEQEMATEGDPGFDGAAALEAAEREPPKADRSIL